MFISYILFTSSLIGNYEVCLYGTNLDEAVMRYAQVFVDVFTVPPQNWSVASGNWPMVAPRATHCLRVRVPPMPVGEVWIEVETLNRGRLHCPEPFVYQDEPDLLRHSMRGIGGAVGDCKPAKPAAVPTPTFADFDFKEPVPVKPPVAPVKKASPGKSGTWVFE